MDYDNAYANAKFIPDAETYPPRWAEQAEAFRQALGPRTKLDQRYGEGDRQWFDLFVPDSAAKGLIVFVHGGYWLRFSPRDFSHLAAGALAQGWAVAMPAYTLAPAARIAGIVDEIAAALPVMAGEVDGPIALTGHSAGGHLVARMVTADMTLPVGVAQRIARVVPISPVADLRPLMQTAMNDDLKIDRAEALAHSPALLPIRPGVEAHIWVGAEERPAFLDQARRLGNAWACRVTADKGRHHFDVIEGLEIKDSPLMQALIP